MDMNMLPLGPNESLSKGELVGIGVSMDQAPSFLLRVVMVRGQGANEGVPFSHSICPNTYGAVSLYVFRHLVSVHDLNPTFPVSTQTPFKGIIFYRVKFRGGMIDKCA